MTPYNRNLQSLFLLDSSPSLPSLCVGDCEGSDEGGRGLKVLHVVILHLVEAALGEGPHRPELLILRSAAKEVLLSPLKRWDQGSKDVFGEVGEQIASLKYTKIRLLCQF